MSSTTAFNNTNLKPLKLYGDGGPNPTKVVMLLELLHLPYEAINVPLTDVKKPDYTALNPNGRLPTLVDPNKADLTIWESGAIYTYLATTYDPSHKLSFPADSPEAWHAQQWLYFQVSGQGPYYGQAFWFQRHHPDPMPSAVDRYINETKRVMHVLDDWLAKQAPDAEGKKWLVGSKLSYTDVAFVTWQLAARAYMGIDDSPEGEFPVLAVWMKNLLAIDEVMASLKKCEPYAAMFKEDVKA